MGILAFNVNTTGLVGSSVVPRRCTLTTTDNLATITAAGYLNSQNLLGNTVSPSDIFDVLYSFNTSTGSGTFGVFQPDISNGVITLNAWENPGDVLLPVVSGDFAVFNGTSGQIKDAGYLPSNASKTKVVMANGTVIANHIATYADTAGTVSNDATTAINGGNIQAGLSGTAGYIASFPTTASKGSLRVVAANNAGDTVTQITNASYAQASVLTLPDPAGATANFNLSPAALVNNNLIKASGTAGLTADAGIAASAVQLNTNIKAAVTGNIGGGGAGPINVSVTGMTASSVVVATVASSSNAVSVLKTTAGSGQFAITFTADPGATCTVNYVAFIAAQ